MSVPQKPFDYYYVVLPNGCWYWCGTTSRGYGQYKVNGRQRYAHRLSYEANVGPIPDGLQLDHLCRTPRCVNWRHLEPVTVRENMMRSPVAPCKLNAIKTCCPKHGTDYYFRHNQRWCRDCRLESGRKTDAKRRRVQIDGVVYSVPRIA